MHTCELANLDGQANLLLFSKCSMDAEKLRESMIQAAWSKYLEYLTQQLLKYITRLACPRTMDGQTLTHLY